MDRTLDNRRGTGTALTRRRVMGLAGGAAAGLAGAGPWPARARQATPAATTEDRPVLRVGVQELPTSLDPHLPRNVRWQVIDTVFDTPLRRDFRNGDPPGTGVEIGAMLATEWERLDDLTLRLRLREGVTFHDGASLTAADVAFGVERVLNDGTGELVRAQAMLGTIAGIEVEDPLTLRLTTTAPDPILDKRIASWGALVIPRAAFEAVGPEAFGFAPVGSGPYRVVEYRPDDALILDSHDAYWAGTPPASRVEIRSIPELSARVAAVTSGEIDIATAIPPDQVPVIDGADGVETRTAANSTIAMIHYNTLHPVLKDVRLRQALNLAIDRQLIVDSLWQGRAEVPRGYQFPNWGDMYDEDRPVPAYDPARAMELIAATGYDGQAIPLRIATNYYVLGEQVAEAIVEMWRAVGLNASTELIQNQDYFENPEQTLVSFTNNPDEFADPESFWVRFNDESQNGKLWWPNPRFTEFGNEARRTLDTAGRRAAFQSMLDVWENDAAGTELYTFGSVYGVRSDIDWQPYSFYYLDFRASNLRLPAR